MQSSPKNATDDVLERKNSANISLDLKNFKIGDKMIKLKSRPKTSQNQYNQSDFNPIQTSLKKVGRTDENITEISDQVEKI